MISVIGLIAAICSLFSIVVVLKENQSNDPDLARLYWAYIGAVGGAVIDVICLIIFFSNQ